SKSDPGDAPANPRNDLEKWMLALWREVLGKQDIGIHDNFFNSGGNSLRSLQLISRISTGLASLSGFIHFGGNIPVKLLFLNQTVAELSAAIEKRQKTDSRQQTAGGAFLCHPSPFTCRGDSHQPFPQAMTIAREPLLHLFDTGRISPVDAAAIICLPDELVDQPGLGKGDFISQFSND
ncbi:MAG: hypothetical protein J0651_02445, partial [Actinobacteria bacterium]|nr:hypothetical protein [Actinomycetota bacterium]